MTKRMLTIAAISAISFGVASPAGASCGSDDDFVIAEVDTRVNSSPGVVGVYRGGDSPAGVYVAADTGQGVTLCSADLP